MFEFNVSVTESDYFDFNLFTITKTNHGKKQLLKLRIFMTIFFAILAIIALLITNDYSIEYIIIYIALFSIMCLIFQLVYLPSVKQTLKHQLKALKKNGKLPFTPLSTITFEDDKIIEQTEVSRNELKYSSIESIYINTNKAIYLYFNSLAGYIVPLNVFKSSTELEEFLNFLQTKSQNIIYDHK